MRTFATLVAILLQIHFSGVVVAAPRFPLVDAVKKNHAPRVNELLRVGVIDVNQAHPDGMTALHWSVYHDNTDWLKRLVELGADVDIANRYGVRPLAIACTNGNDAAVRLLLASGADANASLRGGETPLMTAARTGRVECVRALLEYGAKVDAKERKGQTAIMWAAAEGHRAVVQELIDAGADFETPLKSGFTPFFFAVREGRQDVASHLLTQGVDVDARMRVRRKGGKVPSRITPLMLAVENGHFSLAATLLEAGADPNAQTNGATALHALTWVRKPIRGDGDPPPTGSGTLTSLAFARHLIASGADINARHGKRTKDRHGRLNKTNATPFLLAAETGDVALMKLLVELGADPSLTNADECTPLLAATGVGILGNGDESAGTEEEAIETVEYLLSLGADINTVEANGESAMHGAAYKSWTKLIQYLADHDADLEVWNRKNRRGWTPLMIAQGHRPGNFRYSAETVAAVEKVMRAAGVEPPAPAPRGTRASVD